MASIIWGAIGIVGGTAILIYSMNQRGYGGDYGAGRAAGLLFAIGFIGAGIFALVSGIRESSTRTFKPRKRRRPQPRRYRDDDDDDDRYDNEPPRRRRSRDRDDCDDEDDEPRSRRRRDRERDDDDDDRRPRRTSRRRDDDD